MRNKKERVEYCLDTLGNLYAKQRELALLIDISFNPKIRDRLALERKEIFTKIIKYRKEILEACDE